MVVEDVNTHMFVLKILKSFGYSFSTSWQDFTHLYTGELKTEFMTWQRLYRDQNAQVTCTFRFSSGEISEAMLNYCINQCKDSCKVTKHFSETDNGDTLTSQFKSHYKIYAMLYIIAC